VAHVVTAQVDVILDGFTIVGGDATGSADPVGGGILSREGSPLIRNCIVRDNVADDGGGAWFSGPNPVVEDCAFWYNEATNSGGAMQLGSGELRRNQFAGNRAGDDCGGVGVNGAPVVENCVFRQNEAIDYAGGLCIGPGAGAAIVVNNTFYDNHAPHGGGALSVNNDTSVVANNVALDNTGQYGANILLFNGKLSSIHHNCGNGNMSGSDNVDADPQLTAPGNADFRLAATSPCIDAADDALAPPEDAAGAARYDVAGVGSSVADMGAFEARP
jgi:hypothetical protein